MYGVERCPDVEGLPVKTNSPGTYPPVSVPSCYVHQDDRLAWPEGWVERFLFIFGLPFLVGLSLTVPDCSRPQYEKYYVVTFVMSITWISIISSYMVRVTLTNAADGSVEGGASKRKSLCMGGKERAFTRSLMLPHKRVGVLRVAGRTAEHVLFASPIRT